MAWRILGSDTPTSIFSKSKWLIRGARISNQQEVVMRLIARAGSMIAKIASQVSWKLPAFLDWLLSIVERVLVLALSFAIFYSGCHMVRGQADKEIAALAKLGESWKVFLLLLVPLFYRTINRFINEAHEAFGVKRNLQSAALPAIQGASGAAPSPPNTDPNELHDGLSTASPASDSSTAK
jgi:hypothetical protein